MNIGIKDFFKKDFYRYLKIRSKQYDIGDYFFVSGLTILIFIVIFIVNLLFNFSGEIDIHFPKLDIEISIIENLIRTISVFISIIFSFIILSFNLFYRNFGRSVFFRFFKNRWIKYLFTLFVCTIIFMIYSLSHLKEDQIADSYSNSLFFLSIVFCLMTIISIFPTIIKLIKESQNRQNIENILDNHDLAWAISYEENVNWDKSHSYKHYEKDPITLVTEIGTVAIKDCDEITINTIFDACKNYLVKTIENKEEDKYISPYELYEKYRKLVMSLFNVALKEKNEIALFDLVFWRFEIEKQMIEYHGKINNQNEKYKGWALEFDLKANFNRAIQFNEEEVSIRIIDHYCDYVRDLINSYLLSIKFDVNPNDLMHFQSEKSMIFQKIDIVEYFSNTIINSKKIYLFENIFNFFTTIEICIINSSNPHNSNVFLLNMLNKIKKSCFELFLKNSNSQEIFYKFFPFRYSPQEVIKLKTSISFNTCLQSIDLAFSHDKLNNLIINVLRENVFNFLRLFGEHKIYKELIEVSLKKFDSIRSKIFEDSNDYKKDLYIRLEINLNYIFQESKKYEYIDISELIDSYLKQFIYIEQFQKDLYSKGYISDNRIY